MKTIDAERVAEELVKIFSRVGIPREILTDQGSNFTSHLLTEIYRFLHVHPIPSTPYHPQTDGLVERFNKTLKSLLRKATADIGKDRDTLLPCLLFAYREVPQASTSFSPFELLYGRAVNGPLDVLKKIWEADQRSTESVVSRVGNAGQAGEYDRTCAEKSEGCPTNPETMVQPDSEGDQVLVLLPTSTNKLLAKWRGPYRVLKREGKVTYQVDKHDACKRKRVLHVNMLRQWHTPVATSFFAEGAEEEEEMDNDFPEWRPSCTKEPRMGEQLTTAQ